MYHALLTNRYLTTRVIPFIAVGAVALCVALVIIVVSVMSGFLDLVRDSGRKLMGDVVISAPGRGLPHYQELIDRLNKLPEVAAATPVVESFGMLRMPYKQTEQLQLFGVEPASFAKVTSFGQSLVWPQTPDQVMPLLPEDDPLRVNPQQVFRNGLELRDIANNREGIVLGVHLSDANFRQKDGTYRPQYDRDSEPAWPWWMPLHDVAVSMFPSEPDGTFSGQPRTLTFPVVNEFYTGVYLIDDKRAIVPLRAAQELLGLDEQQVASKEEVDEAGLPRVERIDPARVTQVLVRGRAGVRPEELAPLIDGELEKFTEEVNDAADLERANGAAIPRRAYVNPMGLTVKTWEEQQAQFLGPIQKERELMRTLFSIVNLVCAGLVLAIFWGIVHEKTRDIGILRSVGASRAGVLWIFLRYGLVIGVIGSLVGLGLAYVIVKNINHIHDALGDPPLWLGIGLFVIAAGALLMLIRSALRDQLLPTMVWSLAALTLILLAAGVLALRAAGGVTVWNPEVYLFTSIPDTLDMETAARTMIGAVLFSVLGATLPAAKAADTDPVQALRYE